MSWYHQYKDDSAPPTFVEIDTSDTVEQVDTEWQGIPIAYDPYTNTAYVGTAPAHHEHLVAKAKGGGTLDWKDMMGMELGEVKGGTLVVSAGQLGKWSAIAHQLGLELYGNFTNKKKI